MQCFIFLFCSFVLLFLKIFIQYFVSLYSFILSCWIVKDLSIYFLANCIYFRFEQTFLKICFFFFFFFLSENLHLLSWSFLLPFQYILFSIFFTNQSTNSINRRFILFLRTFLITSFPEWTFLVWSVSICFVSFVH